MGNILTEIAEKTRERIEEQKRKVSLAQLREEGERALEDRQRRQVPGLKEQLERPGMSYICEVKKASPSKGLIASDFPYLEIAEEYERAGASAVSCLTEPFYFQGSDRYLKEIAARIRIPVLRKDFTVDEYMIYEAQALGASAVLLICTILDDCQLKGFRQLAAHLGMDALVEAHDERETERALAAGAEIVGINNRDLRTFQVDCSNSVRLRRLAPPEVLFVSESGIRTGQDIRLLKENRVDGVLIGETLMRSPDKGAALAELNGGPLNPGRTHGLRIKICGLKRPEDVEAVNLARPDYCGFIIEAEKSSRSVSRDRVRELVSRLEPGITPVGVFCGADLRLVAGLLEEGSIAMAQLHGDEDETYIRTLRELTDRPLIQAFSVKSKEDVSRAAKSSADYILLDQGGGGTGEPFDWSLVSRLERPWFLAGGLGIHNMEEAVRRLHPWAVDLSSSLETDGQKDAEKIMAAVRMARRINIE